MFKSKRIISLALICTLVSGIGTTVFASGEVNRELLFENNLKEIALKSPNTYVTEQQQLEFDQEISEAYERVDREEEYIVSLINQRENTEVTDKTNWEFNLKYLKDNYLDLKSGFENGNISINMSHINSYIEAYEFVALAKDVPSEKVSNSNRDISLLADSNYNIDNAVNYAETYYSNYNSSYPDWTSYGGDCANFVSQSLYAGGKSMVGTPGTSAAASNFSNWFSKGSSNSTTNVSSTWRGADAFKHYWTANAESYKTFTSFTTDTYDYGYRGDAVTLLNSNNRGYHTLLIVAYGSNGDLIYAAHTGNTKTGSLKSTSSSFIIYHMKFN